MSTRSPTRRRRSGFVLDTLGEHCVVLGSDYPFRMGAADPIGALGPLELGPSTGARLLRENAREFLERRAR